MTQLASGKQFVCETCGEASPNWGMCLPKGLGAGRGHDWSPIPDCLACGDTGYEDGMPGYYCTFCKKGCAVASAQMKAGVDPWSPHAAHQVGDAPAQPCAGAAHAGPGDGNDG